MASLWVFPRLVSFWVVAASFAVRGGDLGECSGVDCPVELAVATAV